MRLAAIGIIEGGGGGSQAASATIHGADDLLRNGYVRAMRKGLIMLALVMLSTGVPAAAQLLREQVDGMQRLCLYPPASGNFLSTDSGQRQLRVGLGENCPSTYPSPNSILHVPPTARLRQTRSVGATERCTYEEGPSEWTIPVPSSGICPLFAGIGQEQREGGQ